MLSSKLYNALIALLSVAGATAILSNDVMHALNAEAPHVNTLVARNEFSYYPEFRAYGSNNCNGAPDTIKDGFGCGGTCFATPNGLGAIELLNAGIEDKPTVGCYTNSGCSGSAEQSSGVANGHTSSCTVQKSQIHSCYLYFRC
jgi:hypothetical protein